MTNRNMYLVLMMLTLLSISILLSGCGSPVTMYEDIDVTSTSFTHSEVIPAKYSRDGENVSPQIKWGTLPEKTDSIAVVCYDSDGSEGEWVHWVMYNIPSTKKELAEGIAQVTPLADGSIQGKNSWGNTGYDGPQVPSGQHRYYYRVFALNTTLTITGTADKAALYAAMAGHIIGEGRLMGLYGEETIAEEEE